MEYQVTTWVDGETPLSSTNMNKIETGIKNAQDIIEAQKTKVTALENKTKTLEQQISSLENLNRINTNPVNFDIGFTASEQAYVPLFNRVAGSYRIVNNICYVSLEIGFNQTGNWNFSAQQYPYPLVTKTKLPKPSSLVMLNLASEGITPIGNCIYLGTRHENNVKPSLDDNGTGLFLRYIKPEDRGQWYKTMFDYPIDVDHWIKTH